MFTCEAENFPFNGSSKVRSFFCLERFKPPGFGFVGSFITT